MLLFVNAKKYSYVRFRKLYQILYKNKKIPFKSVEWYRKLKTAWLSLLIKKKNAITIFHF